MSQLVASFVSNGVLHIELNRLDKKNALVAEMYQALTQVFSDANQNSTVKVILFKGGQGCFCAGNDIADFLDESVLAADGHIATFLHQLADTTKPLVAAVSGPAIGIGTTMLLHCDLVYATNKAVFSLPFVNLGVCAEAGSSYLLPKQIGRLKASELLLLGEAFDAEKAKNCGIINDIVDEETYWQFAQKQAEKLATKPQAALTASKKLLAGDGNKLHQVIDQEIELFAELLKTDDAKAIFKSFLQKSD